MASKSKRRGRVFRASCILAALIIAGSSFAWFTSKDEVTNRLSASADYNVSIIENFVPPKQWTPGQTVKKEEGVVNTGAVDAFVKQTISGNLQVTVEVPTTVKPTATGVDASDYVTLTQKEFGSLEAGSTLAWVPVDENGNKKDTVNKIGVIIGLGIDGKIEDDPATTNVNEDNHAFVPAAEGLYVFRRAVHKSTATPATDDEFEDVSYDYVGYYYVPGTGGAEGTYYKLYKIKVDEGNIYTAADDTDPNGRGYSLYGTLKSEPAYSFAKLVTTTMNKVSMTYENRTADTGEEVGKRLKVLFNGQNTVDSTIAATSDSDIYTAYHNYLDLQKGRTTYKAPEESPATKYPAFIDWNDNTTGADTNATGLTDYDIYNNGTTGADDNTGDGKPKADLSNFGYERLEALKNQTAAERTSAETDYPTLQNEARTSRKTINTGMNSEKEIEYLKGEVTTQIGTAGTPVGTTDPDAANTGLYLKETKDTTDAEKNVSTFEWYAKQLYDPSSPNTSPYIMDIAENETLANLQKWFVTSGGTNNMTFKGRSATGDNDYTLTVDTMKQPRFADPEQTANDPTDGTEATTRGFGTKVVFADQTAPYNGVTSSDLKTKWDELLKQTQRKALNLIKQRLLEDVISNGTPAETDAGRTIEECKAYLAFLKEQYKDIESDYNDAKDDYEKIANKVADMLKLMNARQTEVDNANKEYNGYYTSTGDYTTNDPTTQGAETTYTSVTYNTQNEAYKVHYANQDSVKENSFEAKLIKIFGVAKKDAATALTNADGTVVYDYTGVDNCEHTTSHNQTSLTTYGYDSTMTAITKNLTTADSNVDTDNGVTSWKTLDTVDPTVVESEKTAIQNAPFYKDYITGKMKDFREKQATAKYKIYQGLIDAAALYNAETSAATNDVVLYVNLANIATVSGNPATVNAVDKWQYMGTADANTAATDFVFGYTGILESGEVSSYLIKSVEFDSATKQEAFKDLKFDLNVAAESAQVVYNGTRISSEAAKDSITVIEPTELEYANSDEKVTWKLDGTPAAIPTTAAGFANDPNPKDVNVAPKTYKVQPTTGEAVASMTPVQIEKLTMQDADNTDYELNYKLVYEGVTYYGKENTNDTKYYALNEAGTKVDKTKYVTLKVE